MERTARGSIAPAIVRTITPLIAGWLLSLPAVRWVGVDDAQFHGLVAAALGAVYYVLIRAVESRWPRVGVLLGWVGAPVYLGRLPEADRPAPDTTTWT